MSHSTDTLVTHEHIALSPSKEILFRHTQDNGCFVSNHWHNATELIYMINGRIEVQIEGKCRLYPEGSIALINSRLIHATKTTQENEMLLIQIPYPLLKKYIPEIHGIYFDLDYFTEDEEKQEKIKHIKHLVLTMLKLTNEHPDGEALLFNSLLFDLLYTLYHDFRKEQLQTYYRKHEKNLDRLEPVLEYTNKNYQTQISLAEIAGVISVQPEYFCRFFKKNMGITYLQYLNEVRLSHIYNDLLTTEEPLSHLLEFHGFLNYKVFRRMFFEKFNDTPGNVRKKMSLSKN
ncbi:MAG: helix-turn-helix transcriptional regulator [Clostridium sp.]|nr:helix-turn-helix transcriptional regulator [Clostridium sp.]